VAYGHLGCFDYSGHMGLVLALGVVQLVAMVMYALESSPKVLSPILWFLGAWWLSLLLELCGPIAFPDLEPQTIVLTLVCIVGVCIGYVAGERVLPSGKSGHTIWRLGRNSSRDVMAGATHRGALILGMASLFGWVLGPLRILLAQPTLLSGFVQQGRLINAVLQQQNSGLPGYLQMLGLPALLLSVAAAQLGRRHSSWLLVLLPIPALFLTTRRGYGIAALIAVSYVLLAFAATTRLRPTNTSRRKRSPKVRPWVIVAAVSIATLMFFGLIQSFTGKLGDTVSGSPYSTRYRLPTILVSATEYTSANLPALDAYASLDTSSGMVLGYTLRPVYTLLGNLGLVDQSNLKFANEFVDVGVRTNTAPFFAYWSFDLGAGYAAICCVLVGLVVGHVFQSFRRHRGIRQALVSGVLVATLVLSIRANLLLQTAFFVWVFALESFSPGQAPDVEQNRPASGQA
jgi:hypothetical protein